MSALPAAIHFGVLIQTVRVIAHPPTTSAPARRAVPRLHANDHRIVVDELSIEVDATLDPNSARRLGKSISQTIGENLRDFQQRRYDSFIAGRSSGGLLLIRALRVRLRNMEARYPDSRAIAVSLSSQLERRVSV